MLVSKAISTNSWKQVHIKDLDITAININFSESDLQIAIFNVYLNQSHSEALKSLELAAKNIHAYLTKEATQPLFSFGWETSTDTPHSGTKPAATTFLPDPT